MYMKNINYTQTRRILPSLREQSRSHREIGLDPPSLFGSWQESGDLDERGRVGRNLEDLGRRPNDSAKELDGDVPCKLAESNRPNGSFLTQGDSLTTIRQTALRPYGASPRARHGPEGTTPKRAPCVPL